MTWQELLAMINGNDEPEDTYVPGLPPRPQMFGGPAPRPRPQMLPQAEPYKVPVPQEPEEEPFVVDLGEEEANNAGFVEGEEFDPQDLISAQKVPMDVFNSEEIFDRARPTIMPLGKFGRMARESQIQDIDPFASNMEGQDDPVIQAIHKAMSAHKAKANKPKVAPTGAFAGNRQDSIIPAQPTADLSGLGDESEIGVGDEPLPDSTRPLTALNMQSSRPEMGKNQNLMRALLGKIF